MIPHLNERSQAILRFIVDTYMGTGEPVASRMVTDRIGLSLSSATIRNVMAELELAGLLYSPHTSAGRLPTQEGLRFYVDGLMQVGNLTAEERREIEVRCKAAGRSMTGVLEQATLLLSGLSSAASLVTAPKTESPVRQIQFVPLDSKRILVILVTQGGLVENRVMEIAAPVSAASLTEASNYLNSRLAGKTLNEARTAILREIQEHRTQLDSLTAGLVSQGIALPFDFEGARHIIVRGQSRLLDDVRALEDIEKARQLMIALEEQETLARLLESANNAEGVQIYIGTEHNMFDHSGWSMAISPYKNARNEIVGAIGVIGPNRLNYSRVIPLLDYTSKVMERLLAPLE